VQISAKTLGNLTIVTCEICPEPLPSSFVSQHERTSPNGHKNQEAHDEEKNSSATVQRAGKETGVYVGRKKRQGDDPDSILENYDGDNSGDQHQPVPSRLQKKITAHDGYDEQNGAGSNAAALRAYFKIQPRNR